MSVLILFLSMVLNGIFAMAEIALVSSRRVRLEKRAENGEKGAVAALELMEEPNRFLSTVQIGITLVGIFSGAYGASQLSQPLADVFARISFLEQASEEIAFAILVLIITYFSLVIGELIPKRIAINKPEAISSSLSIPMRFLSNIAKPLVSILSASSKLGVRLLGIKPVSEPEVTEEEIKVLIEQGQQLGVVADIEQDMISAVFRLGDRRVQALMTPRLEIEWININDPFEEIWHTIKTTEYSRILVADDDLDNILGFIRIRDLLKLPSDKIKINLQDFIKIPIYLPENMAALSALKNFQIGGVHLAVVVDEYGGITGMVTDYDILRTIIGDTAEGDGSSDNLVIQREDGSWLFDGLIVIDQLKEILELAEIPDQEQANFQTLSGFVMSRLGRIPKTGDTFTYQDYQFEVVDMDNRRVDRVLVSKRDQS